MVLKYVGIGLKLSSLGLVIVAGGLWIAAGVDTRPKYRDEQTLVGGSIWSQIVIPIGLVISTAINENLSLFVHGYFLISGIILLALAAIVLIIGEFKAMSRRRRVAAQPVPILAPALNSYDKMYFGIGILTLLAAIVMTAEFFLVILK